MIYWVALNAVGVIRPASPGCGDWEYLLHTEATGAWVALP